MEIASVLEPSVHAHNFFDRNSGSRSLSEAIYTALLLLALKDQVVSVCK